MRSLLCTAPFSVLSFAPEVWIPVLNESKNIFLPLMFDHRDTKLSTFHLGCSGSVLLSNFFFSDKGRRSSKHCLRLTAFSPSAASMQIRALGLFFVFSPSIAAIRNSAERRKMVQNVNQVAGLASKTSK